MEERCAASSEGSSVCQARPFCDNSTPCVSAADICVEFSIGGLCVPKCTPATEASTCLAANSACLALWDGTYACLGTGTANTGDSCQYLNDCVRGNACLGDKCQKVCTLSAPDCASRSSCYDFGAGKDAGVCWVDGNLGPCDSGTLKCAGGSGICLDLGYGTRAGICFAACDVFSQNCSTEDAACYLYSFETSEIQLCLPRFTSDGQEGETCTQSTDCGRDLDCARLEGETSSKCMRYCAGSSDCRFDQDCTQVVGGIGLCVQGQTHIGESRVWWVYDFSDNSTYQTQTTQIAESLHARIYLEQGQTLSVQRAQAILDEFENGIYPGVRKYFGDEPNPGIDGIPQVMIVYMDIKDSYSYGGSEGYIAGYFSWVNELTEAQAQQQGRYSNEAEVLFMDTNPSDVAGQESLSTLAHEFQHMVHFQAKPNAGAEHSFVDEGMAMLAEDYCGFGPQYDRMQGLMDADHSDSLTLWGQELADYSSAYAFARYAADQFDNGGSLLNLAMENGLTGSGCWNSALASAAGTTFDITFGNWVIANVMDTNGSISPYGYTSFSLHDAANGLNGFRADGTNVNGQLGSLDVRSFEAYYYSAQSGTLVWENAGAGIHASALLGRTDGLFDVVPDLLAGQARSFSGKAWLVIANHSDTTSAVGGTVSYLGRGLGVPLPVMAQMPPAPRRNVRMCGTTRLPF